MPLKHKHTLLLVDDEVSITKSLRRLSRTILEHLPLPVIGVSSEGMIVLVNQAAHAVGVPAGDIAVGKGLSDCFPTEVEQTATAASATHMSQTVKGYSLYNGIYDIEMAPMKGPFQGKDLIMTLKPSGISG
jgi:nitrogen fixation/metabolism regulation signal transduction histidine kinase